MAPPPTARRRGDSPPGRARGRSGRNRPLVVDLAISPDDLELLYRGAVRDVVARLRDGRTLRFPANALRGHVTRSGVHGTFEVLCDADHRLVGVRRLA